MASFYSVLSFMAVSGFEYSDPGSFDMISSLPLEMAIIILRMLPGKDLLHVASVNKKWFNICKSDCKLRRKVRRHIRQQRRAWISTRVLGTNGSRSGQSQVSNRPTRTIVVNTANVTNVRGNRLAVEASTSRYMPYRREATLGNTRGNSSRRRIRNVEENNSARCRIRM